MDSKSHFADFSESGIEKDGLANLSESLTMKL
jgi:hypothetical protein